MNNNKGFEREEIKKFKARLAEGNGLFLVNEDEENSDEFVHFYFLGKYRGKDVIYDAALYTLRLHHQSEMYEIAEHEAAKRFPHFKKIKYEEDEFGDIKTLDDLEEEIGLFMSEKMMEMEEEGSVKVREFCEVDPKISYGIGVDAALNVEKIDEKAIKKFIKQFNDDNLVLDETLYSFEFEEDVDE